MTANEILRKHFKLMTDIAEGAQTLNDNCGHYWLINKDWPVIGSTIVLSKDEYLTLKKCIFDASID